MKILLKGEWYELTLTKIVTDVLPKKKKSVNGLNDDEVIENLNQFLIQKKLFGMDLKKGDYINFYCTYNYENLLTYKKTTMLLKELCNKYNYKFNNIHRNGKRYLIIQN